MKVERIQTSSYSPATRLPGSPGSGQGVGEVQGREDAVERDAHHQQFTGYNQSGKKQGQPETPLEQEPAPQPVLHVTA